MVCTIAFVFRQKGHHYITDGDYEETYTRIWSKITREGMPLASTWLQRATIGLHAIMPDVLDAYWRFSVHQGRVAAPLALRLGVPAAGTAAIFALLVGWEDAQSVYSPLLRGHEETHARLVQMVDDAKRRRWRNGINARYYGESPARLDLSQFSALAATIVGVYEAAAEGATLLKSKSMRRESTSAPLQNIAGLAARALRSVFVKALARGPQHPTPQLEAP